MKTYFRAAIIAAISLVLVACASAPAPTAPPVVTQASSTAGMDHSNTSMSANAPFDAMFIDGMIGHHLGAIDMANDALKKAQRPEIKSLAGNIIKAQAAEIQQMRDWRKAWFPDLKDTGGLTTGSGTMAVAEGDAPYDLRFIDAMIPHHESAIAMAQMALQQSQKPEIKQLADAIIVAQTAEIAQMKQWREEWFQ